MKKILLFVLLNTTLFAKIENDVSLTWAHNSFDDDKILFGSARFYGVRAGAMIDDAYGAQIGYEQTRAANCQGLTLRRYYVNGVLQTELENGLKPYAVATFGYETSNKDYRPNQTFMGLGAGIKYRFSNNTNLFLETRALKSMETKEVTWATTLGIGYTFNSMSFFSQSDDVANTLLQKSNINPVVFVQKSRVQKSNSDTSIYHDTERQKPIITKTMLGIRREKHGFYVQIVALESASPFPYIKQLQAQGYNNASVRKARHRKLVVVGPYVNREGASSALSDLKSIRADAFITQF